MKIGLRLCYDPGTLLLIGAAAAGASATSSIIGGFQQNSAAKKEAALQEQQGQLAYDEAQRNAALEAKDQTQFVQRQKLAFLSSGVSLEGSPIQVLEESRSYGQEQVQAILNQGAAQKNLALESAANTRNKGRAALIGGIAKGVSDLGTAAFSYGQGGGFDTKTTTFKTGGSYSNTARYNKPNMRGF